MKTNHNKTTHDDVSTVKFVPCMYCGNPTSSTYTKLCDRCWELKNRIKDDFVIATKIYDDVMEEFVEEAINAFNKQK